MVGKHLGAATLSTWVTIQRMGAAGARGDAAEMRSSRPRNRPIQSGVRGSSGWDEKVSQEASASIAPIKSKMQLRFGQGKGETKAQSSLAFLAAPYFNDVLIELNMVFRLLPRPLTATIIAIEMPAAIRPYSIAVAPLSSARNFAKICFTFCPPAIDHYKD